MSLTEPEDSPEEPGETEKDTEVAAELEKALRPTILNIQRSMAATPKIKLPAFGISESVLKNLTAVSRIVDTQKSMVDRAMKPLFEAQAGWQKQIASINKSFINSDVFKNIGLVQSNLDLIASQLGRNIDLGFAPSASKIVENLFQHQAGWLENLAPALAALRAGFYPPNLRAINDLRFEEVEQVVLADGIPLYGLPRASIAEPLIRADGAAKRREILGRRWKAISVDCRDVVEGCKSEPVARYVPFAVAALDALDAGHTEAAQALSGSLIDTIVNGYFGDERYKFTPDRNGKRTSDAYYELQVRQLMAFAPMWQAYQQFHVGDGDKVPTAFNRHATVHAVSARQFSRRNAVQALMFACSLLCRLHEEASISESAA